MNKKLVWILSAVFLSIVFIYAVTYLTSRKSVLSVSEDDGTWAVYFYNKSYIRQYALDASARELFRLTMKTGTRSYLGGYEGDTGSNWFCVYIKPGSGYYRIFRLAEETENQVLQFQQP
ncbi:MAG TPA: hypothetical protein VJ981_01280 [Gammaproteobacteria bacterium]|nr:hypothetical protein [Gammaproteobacteria bacterium]